MLVGDIPILSKAQIAAAVDRQDSLFNVPEWGGAVRLRAWSTAQRDHVVSLVVNHDKLDTSGKPTMDNQRLMRLLVVYGMAEPVLTEAEVMEKSPVVIDRIATEVMRLNAMNREVALSASMTFRQDAGPDVPVPAGEGSGQDGGASQS